MIPRHVVVRVVAALSFASAFSCASVAGQPMLVTDNQLDVTPRERHPDRILPSELRAGGGATVLDAVRQLRPEFLRLSPPRSVYGEPARPSVYLDSRYAGTLETLGTLSLEPVEEIQRLSAVAAKSVFGSYCKCDGGVIHVRTRR